jgi:hypothetical protein
MFRLGRSIESVPSGRSRAARPRECTLRRCDRADVFFRGALPCRPSHRHFIDSMPTTLDLARRLLALSQSGLHFCREEYDLERYREIARIATELLALDSDRTAQELHEAWFVEEGYATPKVDVRGACFRDDRVLLVRERVDGKWTLPGGWADINETPSQAVEKEIEQESGEPSNWRRSTIATNTITLRTCSISGSSSSSATLPAAKRAAAMRRLKSPSFRSSDFPSYRPVERPRGRSRACMSII